MLLYAGLMIVHLCLLPSDLKVTNWLAGIIIIISIIIIIIIINGVYTKNVYDLCTHSFNERRTNTK